MRYAVYAGSFDPPTKGHLWMIEQGLALFDKLIVAIGSNPMKHYTFDEQSRLDMLKRTAPKSDRLVISILDNRYLVDYAKKVKASFVLRGIRTADDYEYERVMRHINGDMAPDVNTIFLMPPRDISEVSSSNVKGLIGPDGWENIVKRYVTEPVFERIAEKYNNKTLNLSYSPKPKINSSE